MLSSKLLLNFSEKKLIIMENNMQKKLRKILSNKSFHMLKTSHQ